MNFTKITMILALLSLAACNNGATSNDSSDTSPAPTSKRETVTTPANDSPVPSVSATVTQTATTSSPANSATLSIPSNTTTATLATPNTPTSNTGNTPPSTNENTDPIPAPPSSERDQLSQFMIDLVKEGLSANERKELIEKIKTEKELNSKIFLAQKYFCSFEYQILNTDRLLPANSITAEARKFVNDSAMSEFSKTLKDLLPKKMKVTAKSDDNEMLNLYALTFAMGENENCGLTTPRLESGLSAEKTTLLTLAAKSSDEMLLMGLRLRNKVLAKMVLTTLSDLEDAHFFERTEMVLFKWKPNYLKDKGLTLDEVRQAMSILDLMKETSSILISKKMKVELDKSYLLMLKHMDDDLIETKKLKGDALKNAVEINKLIPELSKKINDLLKVEVED